VKNLHLLASPLDALTEDDLRTKIEMGTASAPDNWFDKFQYDLYDWDDPEWKRTNRGRYAWKPIKLTQGYFMMVSPRDYERMTKHPDGYPKHWCVRIDRNRDDGSITGIYASRCGRGNEPKSTLAHRELLDCLFDPGVGDHVNGWGLDNRLGTPEEMVNLCYVDYSGNGHNALRANTSGLPRGVERRSDRFGWKVCKRSGKKVITIRSEETWPTPEGASRGYLQELARLNDKRKMWAHDPKSVKRQLPKFPPLLESEISDTSAQMRNQSRAATEELQIPF